MIGRRRPRLQTTRIVFRRGTIFLLGSSLVATFVVVEGREGPTQVSYRREIAPLLGEHCVACHCEEEASSELVLTTVEALRRGGKRGGAIAPGDPEASLLLQLVKKLREPAMPPEGDALSEAQVRSLERWIREGAKDDTPR